MSLHIGDTAPDFSADTSTGPINFHDWIGTDWVFFFSHPGDFTPVCTTEIGRMAQLADAFATRHGKALGLSTDTVAKHLKWIKDVDETQHTTVMFPIVAHPEVALDGVKQRRVRPPGHKGSDFGGGQADTGQVYVEPALGRDRASG